MSFKRNAFKSFTYLIKIGLRLAENMGIQISSELSEELIPVINVKTKNGVLHFFCPGRLAASMENAWGRFKSAIGRPSIQTNQSGHAGSYRQDLWIGYSEDPARG